MDIRLLKAFLAVFEERNITGAAQRLCVSQPTLSVTIRQLEETLGTTLFERRVRGVEVTEDARLLYPQAQRLVADSERLGALFRERRSCLPLTVGVEADLGPGQVSEFLRRACAAVPTLLLTVVEGCGGEVRLAAEEERCEDELFLLLWEDPFVLALPADHPLARAAQLDPAALAEADWICCPDHPSHQRLVALPGAGGAALAVAAQAGSLTLAAHMVAAGLGLALLPASLLAERPGIVARPLDGPALTRRVGLCFAAQALQQPAVALLYRHLRDATQSESDRHRTSEPA
ncbi:LysR family transcriptional regulator [Neisseriaceae bacterium JH1-16]|nr:LysR family transcriptional regulator [Neisseriaceae bacterium JH1-16]